ncbi:Bax inhibitor-1/YccA family protein [Sphingomonas sp. KRR8]|uniref:Bax inhibitor-1/YccA family protein n=1 Tax=Sphingomonas sp. KRR8 TaxID=2942996 RepID=UPI00201FB7DC|nr:Bax inhibitor-1/YccA family protein [Sphingomonas sp. KRR8]URD62175.1 Bax inhibitor-1/YccA family protein [Sphingomonas sp. KRR8]
MSNWSDPRTTTAAQPAVSVGVPRAARDVGLRSYMLSVYNYMASGVLLTGIVAYALAASGIAEGIFFNGGILRWVVLFAPLIMIMVMGVRMQRMSTGGAQAFFWAFAAVMGVSMSVIPLIYSGTSIAQTFFATAIAFMSLSLWGYSTKKDLSAFGTFLIMGVVGLIVVMLLNMFIRSDALSMVISAVGVLLFAGLTAYDTQKIKSMYAYVAGTDMMGKTAIMGALTLYLDFINMFQFLLSFMGDRR